jgi:hypothetical protein
MRDVILATLLSAGAVAVLYAYSVVLGAPVPPALQPAADIVCGMLRALCNT